MAPRLPTSTDADTGSAPPIALNFQDGDWDSVLDPQDSRHSKWQFFLRNIFRPMRSALLIDLISFGLPAEQRGLFYFMLIRFHEDLYRPLYVYSALPALLLWYFPDILPIYAYAVTELVDSYVKFNASDPKAMLIPLVSKMIYTSFLRIDFEGMTPLLESLWGQASTWPAAVVPLIPGMCFRLVDERPNSVNGFVPENTSGIWMAISARACTVVLPLPLQWMIWCVYTAPSIQYPSICVEYLICMFSWVHNKSSPLGAYALWLIVNQYHHTRTWFRNYGGGPSIVLKSERRGTLWYIVTISAILMLENEAGPTIMENEMWTLTPQKWIPLVLACSAGLYLTNHGQILRFYKYQYKPLPRGKSFRLLRLRAQPCLPNSPIQCDMIQSTLWNPPQYTAISHRWESEYTSQEMILIDGGLFPVSHSIYSFLSRTRSIRHPRYFWIDSICINQADVSEKGSQVGFMRNIYEEAEMVIGWLGDHADVRKALSLVHRICKIQDYEAYRHLRNELDCGWDVFERFVCNDLFERAWIIQEISVGREPTLRCGYHELSWMTLIHALRVVLLHSAKEGHRSSRLIYERDTMNILMIDAIRSAVLSADLIKLEDALKLGLGFKSSLPTDKVFALLGLVEGRHTPLFHPRIKSFNSSGRTRAQKAVQTWAEVLEVLNLVTALLDRTHGNDKSRRAKAIISSGSDSALRYLISLSRDLTKLHTALDTLKNGGDPFDEDLIQLDYSAENTAQNVYTLVARDLIRHNNALSFLRCAGLKDKSSSELKHLPSWVPNWSSDLDCYVLPELKLGTTNSNGRGKTEDPSNNQDPTFQDGGAHFMFIQGRVLDTIVSSTMLTPNYAAAEGKTLELVEADFACVRNSLQVAFQHAHAFTSLRNETEAALEKAFCETLLAGTGTYGKWAATLMRPWVTNDSYPAPLSEWATRCQRCTGRERLREDTDDPRAYAEEVTANYAFVRTMNSSANSKFAHLMRADILPSFWKYRSKYHKQNPEAPRSILNNGSHGPLLFYTPYVDYTINSSFIVTNSGLMGLAPTATKQGDVVFQVEAEGRTVWLVLREEPFRDPIPSVSTDVRAESAKDRDDTDSSTLSKGKAPPPPFQRTFRLVGEAYINLRHNQPIEPVEPEWVRLW